MRSAVVLLRQLLFPLYDFTRKANDNVVIVGLAVDRYSAKLVRSISMTCPSATIFLADMWSSWDGSALTLRNHGDEFCPGRFDSETTAHSAHLTFLRSNHRVALPVLLGSRAVPSSYFVPIWGAGAVLTPKPLS